MSWLIDQLYNLLRGMAAKQAMGQAGVSGPAATVTANIALPTFGFQERQAPVGVAQSRDLSDARPELVRRYLLLKEAFARETGTCIFETCTWRSAEEQQRLYKIGRRGVPGERIVTDKDGVHGKSRHMVYPSEAIDVCVDADPGPGKHPVWNAPAYTALGPLAERFGLVWGGNWASHDYPHLELPSGAV